MIKKLNIWFVLIFISVLFIITGCNSPNESDDTNNNSDSSQEGSNEDNDYPVSLENAGRTIEFDQAPERVIALYQQEAELFAALGLEDKVVGYSLATANTPEEYKDKIDDMNLLAENGYPSKEVMLEVDPDFAIGSERTFNKNGVGDVDDLAKLGITAYVTESEKPETIDNIVFKQIDEISAIFGVTDRGESLKESMKQEIEEVVNKVSDVEEPVKVLLMSGASTGSAQVSGGFSLDSHLIELAGGENIFADQDEYLLEASWEEIVDRNPDVIVTSFCCGTTPEDLQEMVLNTASLSDVTAVKESNFIAIQVEDTTGNVRIPQGLRSLAEGFYPEKFE